MQSYSITAVCTMYPVKKFLGAFGVILMEYLDSNSETFTSFLFKQNIPFPQWTGAKILICYIAFPFDAILLFLHKYCRFFHVVNVLVCLIIRKLPKSSVASCQPYYQAWFGFATLKFTLFSCLFSYL